MYLVAKKFLKCPSITWLHLIIWKTQLAPVLHRNAPEVRNYSDPLGIQLAAGFTVLQKHLYFTDKKNLEEKIYTKHVIYLNST